MEHGRIQGNRVVHVARLNLFPQLICNDATEVTEHRSIN